MATSDQERVRAQVRDTYAAAAQAIAVSETGPSCNVLAQLSYGDSCGAELASVVTASLGCGSPTELVDLRPGQRVVDLGSGGGVDVLLAARRVGSHGHVIGVDMTPPMLALAEANRATAGLDNVEFREGNIEDLPLAAGSVDVVISNCVLSLSVDKPRALAEARRVLAPGGRLAVTDLAALGSLPPAVTASLQAWAGCLAGAPLLDSWPALLTGAGFTDVQVTVARTFVLADLRLLEGTPLGSTLDGLSGADLAAADAQLASVEITATKPGGDS